MKRAEAVRMVVEALPPDALVLNCNGMISREAYTAGDAEGRFYMIGSMGLASSMGLGLALARPERRVIVLDGDGNVLMNMGTLANIAAARPANLLHVVFDNGVHGSTGDQRTVSRDVPLDQVAWACGYPRTERVDSPEGLAQALDGFFDLPGPAMLLVQVEPGNMPGIARVEIEPEAMAQRMRVAAGAP